MNDQTDAQLLRAYAENHSEPAFSELVRRHVELVFSAAKRMVCDSHLAEDVTQAVFVALSKSAAQLTDRAVLSGWLHRTAQNIAAQTVRTDSRRRVREQEAAVMNELLAPESEPSWEAIAPHLDAALGELNEADRDALLLRYFEKKSAREMAGILGISDEAAQKRVNRAAERLRELFSKRKVTIAASALVALIAANAVQAAPVGLIAAISIAVLGSAAVSTSAAVIVTKTIALTMLQKTAVAAVLAAAIGSGIYEAHQTASLREQNQRLQQQLAPLAAQLQEFQRKQDEATNRLAALLAENTQLKWNSNQTELLKLRGEVAQMKTADNDPTRAAAAAVARKVALLKQRLEQTPRWNIPELQFATTREWTEAAWDADLHTEDGVREALSKVRNVAMNKFLNVMMQTAFRKYFAAKGNRLPKDLYELKPYFNEPVTDAMLQRYQLLQSGTLDESADLAKLIDYVDEEYDSEHHMSLHSAGNSEFNKVKQAVETAIRAFSEDHEHSMPADASQLTSYLKTPIDSATVQKYLDQSRADPSRLQFEALGPALKAYLEANHGQEPKNPSDLLPYVSTPEQKFALQKLEQQHPSIK